MALLLIDGFEQYSSNAHLHRAGWQDEGTNWIPVTGRHSGGQAIRGNLNSQGIRTPIFNATDVITVGVAINFFQGISATNHVFMSLRNGGVTHVDLICTSAGELQIQADGSFLEATSGLGLVAGQYYYIELDVTIHDTTGTYDVVVDGVSKMSNTGVDTRNGSTTTVDNVNFQTRSDADMRIDDLYVLDDAGSDNTGLLGDCRVETVFPDADGNEVDFTALSGANWTQVDDGLTPDDDSTYNHSATATDRDLYGFSALSGDIDTIFGVQASMLVRKEEAGFREVRVIGRSNVTEVESGNKTLGVNYTYKSHIFENDPDGGVNWDEAAVNAAQFGLDLQT